MYYLLKDYLSERKQVVKQEERSWEKTFTYSVLQGTVLGPVLFTIKINSLMTSRSKGNVISFADDKAVLYREKTWTDLKSNVEENLKGGHGLN